MMKATPKRLPPAFDAFLFGLFFALTIFALEWKWASKKPYVFVKDVIPHEESFNSKWSEWRIEEIKEIEGPQKMITISKIFTFRDFFLPSGLVGIGLALWRLRELTKKKDIEQANGKELGNAGAPTSPTS